jgi:hypothetical protein
MENYDTIMYFIDNWLLEGSLRNAEVLSSKNAWKHYSGNIYLGTLGSATSAYATPICFGTYQGAKACKAIGNGILSTSKGVSLFCGGQGKLY